MTMDECYEHTIKDFIESIFTVSSRRTSLKFAEESFVEAFSILEHRFNLFKKIRIHLEPESIYTKGFQIIFTEDISGMHKTEIAHALASLIRLIYEDISEESGLYFITEIKNHLQKDNIQNISRLGIDLDQIQSEQHFSYTRKKKKKMNKKNGETKNPLGYEWRSVSNWNYNSESKTVELYDQKGNMLDKIDLQRAIKHYVESLSGSSEMSSMDLEDLLAQHEKSYSFLKLIYQENQEFETAKKMLNLSDEEINMIIKDLIEMKFLQFVSEDEVQLTPSGRKFIEKE